MTRADIIAALAGFDCKLWKSPDGLQVYPPQDPCDFRLVVWQRFSGEGWIVEVERRSAFYWEVTRTLVATTPEEVRAIADETFANDETAKATAAREAGAA